MPRPCCNCIQVVASMYSLTGTYGISQYSGRVLMTAVPVLGFRELMSVIKRRPVEEEPGSVVDVYTVIRIFCIPYVIEG